MKADNATSCHDRGVSGTIVIPVLAILGSGKSRIDNSTYKGGAEECAQRRATPRDVRLEWYQKCARVAIYLTVI